MAYAAVISLKHTIQRLINPTNTQITKSAYEELKLLEDLLKRLDGSSSSSINRTVINELDAQIREAVCKLEDVIESYVLYRSRVVDKKGVKQEIDSFLKTVKKLENKYNQELDNPTGEDDAVSPIDCFGGKKSTTIGLPDEFKQIIDELLDWRYGIETVSLVGMAGIGKTHLATEIYRDRLIVQHFDFTAWVKVGLKDDIKNALVDIVAQIERKPRNLYMEKRLLRLTAILQKSLHGRRYLIVLDDVWSTKVSSYLTRWLPTEGSRLLVTTRLKEVAKFHKTSIYQMRFMNKEESWNLLWRNVFAEKYSFPPQLEKVGRKIAENCEGLPLLILAVASILCGLDKTEEYWKKVADKKTTTFTDAYDQISKVLSLSYEYLPQRLKACFLYMGVFPQSCEIHVPKLINLLTVEDFLEPNQSQTIEEFAMKCLKELVSSSLAIICKRSSSYRIKSSKLHCAYWYLCVKEARKNKFFHVLKNITDVSQDYIESQRRLSVQNNILFCIKEVHDLMAATLTARSLLFAGEDHQYPVPVCFNLMLLKVLDALAIRFYEFPIEVVKLLQLRYLALTHNGKLPPSISNLQQLQCLIVRRYHNIRLLEFQRDSTSLPMEIWDMQELRQLRIMGRNLPDPSYSARLRNLITLYVNAESCTEDVFRGIPYLRKLGIKIELQPDGGETLSCFEHVMALRLLRSLKCVVVNPRLRSRVVAPPDHLSNLPRGLKKLSLNGLGYSWKCVSAIGSLPLLEVLKLRSSAFLGAEWETEAGQFRSLKFLLLEDIDLVHWTIDNDKCFHHLRRLILGHCYKLKEIPRRIGAISTLETVEVVDCSPSVVASALQIQQENINSSVEAVISSSWNLRR